MNRSLILYKYRSFGEYADKIILNSELYFASHTSFNDPFDCNLSLREINSYTDEEFKKYCEINGLTNKNKKEYLEGLRKEFISSKAKVGILSMSLNSKSILMWSHYSDCHQGLCFGFYSSLFENKKSYKKVNYPKSNEYKLISFLSSDSSSLDDMKIMFGTKSEFWEYEEECRFFDFNIDSGIGAKKFEKECLKEIIFGCKADETNIKKIIQLCQLNGFEHVVFKKARIVYGRFELDFDELDKSQYL